MVPNSHILLICPAGVGGVQGFCANLADAFVKAGLRVCVLFEHGGPETQADLPTSAGVQRSVFAYSSFDNPYWVLRRMAKLIASGRFDVVYPNTSAVAYRAIGLLGPGRPVAIGGCTGNNPHDYACNTEFADYLDHVFSVSSQGARVLTQRLADRGLGITIIPHGIKPAEVAPRRSFAGELRLVFAGRFDAGKRLHDVIEVARKLNEHDVPFSLTLAGDGPERPAVERACLTSGIGRKARLLGFISREGVESLMQESHVNLLLSESEGFGLSVLEGMKWGCVPVVTDTCGCIDAMEDGVNGFIVKLGDVERVAELVHQLDRDRALLSRMSASTARTAREDFRTEREVTQHLEILRVAREHHRSRASLTVPWNFEPPSLINHPWVPNWLAHALRRAKDRF